MSGVRESRTWGRVRRAPRTALVVRIVAGLVFVLFGLPKFVAHADEVAAFTRYGLPFPGLTVYLVGILEVVAGLALIAGLAVRVAAALLAADMLGAVSTAGPVDGGPIHLGLAPLLFVAMLFLVWAGGGWLGDRITGRTGVRPAGHA